MSVDPNTGVRTATDVETLTPTLDGTILLDGSIKPGEQITENFITQPSQVQCLNSVRWHDVDLVNGGAATVTFSNSDGSPATISVPTDSLLKPALKFPHHRADPIGRVGSCPADCGLSLRSYDEAIFNRREPLRRRAPRNDSRA